MSEEPNQGDEEGLRHFETYSNRQPIPVEHAQNLLSRQIPVLWPATRQPIPDGHAQNFISSQIPGQGVAMYPTWLPNSATQFQQHQPQTQPQLSYNHSTYPNMYYQQPLSNMSFYQQLVQPPPQYHHTQSSDDLNVPQHISTERNNKNWSKEEDLQLTTAWCSVMTDPVKGVAQKKIKLWDRVLKKFVKLMEDTYGLKPQDNVRNQGGIENRMTEIKSQCSRWTAVRARATADSRSGWSSADIDKLCHKMHEAEGKGVFKWEECWKLLKENPKWQDYNEKKCGQSSSTARPRQHPRSTEVVPNDTNLDALETQTPVTPHTASTTHSEPEVSFGRSICTPILDGPAAIDIDRLPGIKKSKVNNQRQRKIRKHDESQASASQSLTAGLMSLDSTSNSRWEKQEEVERIRDLKDDERYNETRLRETKEHDLKLARECSEVTEKKETIGDKLIAAIQKLDQIDQMSLVTSSQKTVYNIRNKAVEDYERQYRELEEALEQSTYNSPSSAPSGRKMASAGISKKHLFNDEHSPINLSEDYSR